MDKPVAVQKLRTMGEDLILGLMFATMTLLFLRAAVAMYL
jgi:hypothetical protein